MKHLLTILLLQVVDLTHAQSDCTSDFDTYFDRADTGEKCPFYKGKDCIKEATLRGITDKKKRELMMQCQVACGYCGKDTIVKECEDNSCECKDTPNWKLDFPTNEPVLTCATRDTQYSCAAEALRRGLSDANIRLYLTNCAFSCQTCRPCANTLAVGDKVCDPGNNNPKCFKTSLDGQDSTTYDGGDCCNVVSTPFFEEYNDNSLRYTACVKQTGLFQKQYCRCLAPVTARIKDCAGAFTQFGDCSVTCGAQGIKVRVFKVLHAAENGGQDCEAKDGFKDEQPCGNANRVCPATSSTTTIAPPPTTTILTTTTTTSIGIKATTAGGDGEGSKDPNETTLIAQVVKDKVSDAATASTAITVIVCLTELLLRF